MKLKYSYGLTLLCICAFTILAAGCTVTITSNDSLQINLSELDEKVLTLIAEFESEEEERIAGDVTQKSGSVCAGGACIVY